METLDKTAYASKESLLDAIRSRNLKGSTNTGQDIRRTIPIVSSYTTGTTNERRETPFDYNGRNGSNEGGKRSTNGIDSQSGQFDNEYAASSSSDDKYSRPIASNNLNTEQSTSTGKSRWQQLKDTINVRRLPHIQTGTPPKQKKTTVNAKTLTKLEVATLRPKLIKAIEWQSEHADQFIIATTRGHATVVIWSDMDNDDIEIIADFLLRRGQVDVQTAIVVRSMAELMDKIKVGLIVLPRAWRTMTYYLKTGISIR